MSIEFHWNFNDIVSKLNFVEIIFSVFYIVFFTEISVQIFSRVSQNQLANGSEGTMQTRLFLSNMILVTLKIRSRSPDSNHFLRSPEWCICTSLIWSTPGHKVGRKNADKWHAWWPILKNRSRSPNHFLKLFQWCISASLVKIWPLLQKIEHSVFIVIWP